MENATTALATVDALHGLTDELTRLGEAVKAAVLVTEVLHRSGLATLDLVEYLAGKGFDPEEVAHLIAAFSERVAQGYRAEYGHKPLKRMKDFGSGLRPVNSYLVIDQPLVDRVYAAWSSELAVRS